MSQLGNKLKVLARLCNCSLQYIRFILIIIIIIQLHVHFGYENKFCCYLKYPASSTLWFTERERERERESILGIWLPILLVVYFRVLYYCVDIFNPSCHLESSLHSWPVILYLAIALKNLISTVSFLPFSFFFFFLDLHYIDL